LERGELQLFCPDAVDTESWYTRACIRGCACCGHLQYERYILHEFSAIYPVEESDAAVGGYGVQFRRIPRDEFFAEASDVVTHCVTMSGAFDIHQFLDGYYDNDCYFNSPPDFIPNMTDDWFLSRYRQMKIVAGSADWDICLDAKLSSRRS